MLTVVGSEEIVRAKVHDMSCFIAQQNNSTLGQGKAFWQVLGLLTSCISTIRTNRNHSLLYMTVLCRLNRILDD